MKRAGGANAGLTGAVLRAPGWRRLSLFGTTVALGAVLAGVPSRARQGGPSAGRTGPERRWEFLAGGAVTTVPIVGADGGVYFGCSDHNLYAVDGTTGQKRWVFPTSGALHAPPAAGPGGSVYIGSPEGAVYALDAATGRVQWTFAIPGAARTLPGAAVADRGAPHPPGAGAPAVGQRGQLYVPAENGRLYALTSGGRELWRLDLFCSTPSISPRGDVLYTVAPAAAAHAADNRAAIFALRASSSAVVWRFPAPRGGPAAFIGVCAGPDGVVYAPLHVGSGKAGALYALSPTGGKRWTFTPEDGPTPALPCIGYEVVYCTCNADGEFSPDGTDGKPACVYALDARSGAVRWVATPGPRFLVSPRTGPDDMLYVRSENAVLGLSPDNGRTLWTYQCGPGTGLSVSVDGTVFFGAGDRLVALR